MKYDYICHYCGEAGNHREHTVPASFSQNTRHFETSGIVIACPECNMLLSNRIFSSMYERAQYLIERLTRRHRSTLNIPEWSPRELARLSPNMRACVEAGIRDRETLMARLERLSDVKELDHC